jgi:antitoxin (DNA-binding transcriptional repressor) of toxin-antitoxin stability system
MKISTVREVQHNFASLLRLVERGEEIEVFSRKRAVARIVPPKAAQSPVEPVDWSDLMQRLDGIWKGVDNRGRSTGELLDELRGER